jgi:hypothetical protein
VEEEKTIEEEEPTKTVAAAVVVVEEQKLPSKKTRFDVPKKPKKSAITSPGLAPRSSVDVAAGFRYAFIPPNAWPHAPSLLQRSLPFLNGASMRRYTRFLIR